MCENFVADSQKLLEMFGYSVGILLHNFIECLHSVDILPIRFQKRLISFEEFESKKF